MVLILNHIPYKYNFIVDELIFVLTYLIIFCILIFIDIATNFTYCFVHNYLPDFTIVLFFQSPAFLIGVLIIVF